MALISIDPLNIVATLRRDTKLFQWISLLFQMAFSAVVTFCGTVGSALIAHTSTAIAIGYGLLSVASVLAIFFGASDLTRGMMFVRPEKLAEAQLKQDVAITRR